MPFFYCPFFTDLCISGVPPLCLVVYWLCEGYEPRRLRLIPAECIFVNVDVVLSRTLPAVVAHHRAPHKLVSALVVLNAPQSAAYSVLHVGSVVVFEGEAVAVVVG